MKVQRTAVSLTVQIFMVLGSVCKDVAQKEELVVCMLPPACADGNYLY